MEKQIEEMANDIHEATHRATALHCDKYCSCYCCEHRKYGNRCHDIVSAEALYNEGYRKVDNGCTIKMQGESELSKVFNEFLEGNTYVKQKQGEWIEHTEKPDWLEDDVEVYYVCSQCESKTPFTSPYCPCCGAKMKGAE